jgi:hypothetical protein
MLPQDSLYRQRINRLATLEGGIEVIAYFPDRVIVRGTPSGKVYESPRGGSRLRIDPKDIDYILSLQRGPAGCCGTSGQGETRYFALAL